MHNNQATNEGTVRLRAERIIMHPSYNTNTLVNDYALIKLSSPVTFNDKVSNYIPPCASATTEEALKVCPWIYSNPH